MLTQKPIIISVGCSFTDTNFKSHIRSLPDHERGGWPIWTDHFKDKLEKRHNTKYEIIHCGKSGFGNDYALAHISKNIARYGDRIKFVLMGGSEWHRYYNVLTHMAVNPLASLRQHNRPMKMEDDHILTKWRKILHDSAVFTSLPFYGQKDGRERMIHKGAEIYWNILQLCKMYNITLLVYQLLKPLAKVSQCHTEWRRILKYDYKADLPLDKKLNDASDAKAFMSSPHAQDIFKNRKHFLGLKYLNLKNEPWEHYVEHKGLQENLLISWMGENHIIDYLGRVKTKDTHPNAKGHEHIADQLWKHYEVNFL